MLLAGAGLAGWLAVIVVPLGLLFISSFSDPAAGAAAWPSSDPAQQTPQIKTSPTITSRRAPFPCFA